VYLVIGRGDYHWQHEPCWYAVRQKGHWTGDRKQTTLWTIPSGGQDSETRHSTQKPVECMRRPLLNHTRPGEAVYEPFLGSGTTLIAAETTGRVCLAIELDPRYVDVAVRRWKAFTGKPATLLADGRSFDDIATQRLTGAGRGNVCGAAARDLLAEETAAAPANKPRGRAADPAPERTATRRRARAVGPLTAKPRPAANPAPAAEPAQPSPGTASEP
jgi:hypothetical protein